MIKLKFITLMAMSFLLFNLSILADGTGGQLLPFMRYGIGTRALGMGKAYTTLSDEPTGMFWNPAGIAKPLVQNWQLSFGMDQMYFDNSQLSYFSGFYPHRKFGTFGLIYINNSLEGFERRNQFGQYLEDFSINQGLIGFAYARNWGNHFFFKNLATGFLFKSLRNEVYSNSGSTVDLDFGLKWNFSFLKKGTVAFVYQNIMKGKIGEDENTSAYLLGLSYPAIKNLMIATDFYIPSEGDFDLRLGLEYKYDQFKNFPIFVRAGYSNEDITIGASLNVRLPGNLSTQVDYAFANQSNRDINTTSSKFSFTLFGSSEPCDQRFYFLIGDKTKSNTMNYEQFIGGFNKKISDLTDLTLSCEQLIYGPLASILIGSYNFYNQKYSEALINFQNGYNKIDNEHGYAKAFSENSLEQTRDANLVIRYETHANFAETFLHLKQYEEGITQLDPLKDVETFIPADKEDKPGTKYKYRFLYDLALLKFNAGKFNDAFIDLNTIANLSTDDMNFEMLYLIKILKARCQIELKQYDEAISVLSDIPDLSRDFSGVLDDFTNIEPVNYPDKFILDDKVFLIAKCHQMKNETEEAIKNYKKVVYHYPFSDNYDESIEFLKSNLK